MDSNSSIAKPLKLICFDVWGPSPMPYVDGFMYYVLFYEHYSQYIWRYFIKLNMKF